jgi:hypothetical protein
MSETSHQLPPPLPVSPRLWVATQLMAALLANPNNGAFRREEETNDQFGARLARIACSAVDAILAESNRPSGASALTSPTMQ